MYQPKLGRFMSRDPMPENGVTVLSPVPDMRKHYQEAQQRREHEYVYACANPINVVDPSGLKCEIAVHCYNVHDPWLGLPLPARHCGLSISDDSGDHRLDGSGGDTNQIRENPGHHPNAGSFTSVDDKVCKCVKSYVPVFNAVKVPRDHHCGNSNWTLKCMLTHCGLTPTWGFWGEPYGYSCDPCKKWGWELAPADPDAVVCNELTKYEVCIERWECP